MARPKRNSSILEEAQRFIESLQTISETLDFGNGASVQAFLQLIEETRQALAHYNKMLTMVDEAMRDVEDAEAALKAMSKRLMNNVKAYYGEDSREFQKAGGKPRSSQSSKPRQPDDSTPTDSGSSDSPEMQLIAEPQPTPKNGSKPKA
jgi:uncharacterized protein YukE